MKARTSRRWVPAVLALLLLLVACGEGGDGAEEAPPAEPDEAAAPAEEGEEAAAETPDELIELDWGGFVNAATQVLVSYITETGLDHEYGFDLNYIENTSVPTLYSEFSAGAYDMIGADPVALASMAEQGAPVNIQSTIMSNYTWLLVDPEAGIQTPEDLKGKRLAAPTGSGAFRTLQAVAAEWYDFDLEAEVDVVNFSGQEGAAQLLAGQADALFSWETSISQALALDPSLEVAWDFNTEWQDRMDSNNYWFLVVAFYEDGGMSDADLERFQEMMTVAGERIMADPQEADDIAVAAIGIAPGIYQASLEAARMNFDLRPVDATVDNDLRDMIEQAQRAGQLEDLPPDAFYGGR